jgi:DNA-directed RNA polymerase subunit RPC12/RpoP
MTYTLPSPYKCIKCGHEFEYARSENHGAPVMQRPVDTGRGIQTQHLPVCPNCWIQFLLANIGIGFNTQKWRPEGSDYEIEKAKIEKVKK